MREPSFLFRTFLFHLSIFLFSLFFLSFWRWSGLIKSIRSRFWGIVSRPDSFSDHATGIESLRTVGVFDCRDVRKLKFCRGVLLRSRSSRFRPGLLSVPLYSPRCSARGFRSILSHSTSILYFTQQLHPALDSRRRRLIRALMGNLPK